ncbi:MAG: PAS domain-containing protein [Betaproteobacteria bacterium]|nr:PAS domain-containing protein [Betaproteobacteria bacterium]
MVTDEERQRHDSAMARRESFRDLMLTRLNMGDTATCRSAASRCWTNRAGSPGTVAGRDVTVMKQAEHEIAQSRGFLKALIDAIPSPVLLKDGQHRYVEANPSFVEFFERPLDRIVGRTDFDFFTREDATYFLSTDQAALRGDGPVTSRASLIASTTRSGGCSCARPLSRHRTANATFFWFSST